MDEWQRSVKRKYDSLIAEESQKSRKNDNVTFTQSPDLLTNLVDNSSYRVVCERRTADENEKLESNLQFSELPLSYKDSCCGLEEELIFNHSTCNAEQELVLLRKALHFKHKVLNALYTELEEERNASAVAASEAINVIARLQEEKSAMQMEIQHCKMMAEVKGARDEEAIALLKDILMRKDEENFDLMDEIEVYRKVFRRFELERWGKDSCQRILSEIVGKDTGLHLLDGKEGAMSVAEYSHSSANSYWDDTSEDVGNRAFSSGTQNMQISQPYSGGLIFDNVRRDVASMFDTASSGWEEKHQPVHVPENLAFVKDMYDEGSQYSASFKGDASKETGNLSKRRSYPSGDPKSWREKKFEDLGFAEEKCALSHVQCCTQLDIEGRVVLGTEESQDERKAIFGVKFSTCAIEEQEDQYVWERLRRLEERIKHLGEQQKDQRVWLNEKQFLHNDWISDKGEAFVIGSNEVAQKHWKQLKGSKNLRSQLSRNSSANTSGSSSAGSGANIFQNSHSSEKLLMADHAWKNAFTQDIIPEESFNGGSLDIESEGSCIEEQGDIVHDVFEVSHTFMRSRNLLSEESYKNTCATIGHEKCPKTSSEGSISWEIGGSCPDDCGVKTIPMCIMSPTDHELGLVTNTVLQSVTRKCRSVESFDALSTQISIPGEVQQLTLRLQALETERVFMKQAIESLRKENGELRLLREIAQQLRELKGTVENPEQPKERIRWQQLSFLSFFKNLLAFGCLQSCIHPQNLMSRSSFKTNMDPGISFRKHAGLSYLLEESAGSRMVACVTRELKVKLPFGGGTYLSQTFPEV